MISISAGRLMNGGVAIFEQMSRNHHNVMIGE